MRIPSMLAVALLLQACSDRPLPVAGFLHFEDQLRALAGGRFGSPCSKPVKTKAGDFEQGIPIEDCLRFQAPIRMSGIWLTEFEASRFINNARQAPTVWRWTINGTELIPAKKLPVKFASLAYSPPRRAFLVTFVGRRVLYPMHNRWGGTDDTVLIDKIVSIRSVPAPSRAEMCLPHCEPA